MEFRKCATITFTHPIRFFKKIRKIFRLQTTNMNYFPFRVDASLSHTTSPFWPRMWYLVINGSIYNPLSLHSHRGHVWECLCGYCLWVLWPWAVSEMVTGKAHEGSVHFLLARMNVVIERRAVCVCGDSKCVAAWFTHIPTIIKTVEVSLVPNVEVTLHVAMNRNLHQFLKIWPIWPKCTLGCTAPHAF